MSNVFTRNVGRAWKGGTRRAGNLWDDVTGTTAAEIAAEAGKTQADYGQRALDLQEKIYTQGREDMMPWLTAGKKGLGELTSGMAAGEFDMPAEEFDAGAHQIPGEFKFGMDEFQESPYYDFLQKQGQKQIDRSAASRGGLSTGDTLSVLQNRGQMIAAGEFGNQFNRELDKYGMDVDRYRIKRGDAYQDFTDSFNRRYGALGDKYNRKSAISGVGQVQAGRLGTQGANYANAASTGLTGIGNVIGAGMVGGANAKQQGLSQILGLGAKAAGAAAALSDRRLKENITYIGIENGHKVYKFNYKKDPDKKKMIGVMAQDVIKTNPDAVITQQDGFMAVNYDKIGVNFREA